MWANRVIRSVNEVVDSEIHLTDIRMLFNLTALLNYKIILFSRNDKL